MIALRDKIIEEDADEKSMDEAELSAMGRLPQTLSIEVPIKSSEKKKRISLHSNNVANTSTSTKLFECEVDLKAIFGPMGFWDKEDGMLPPAFK